MNELSINNRNIMSSLTLNTPEEKKKMFNALQNPTGTLKSLINTEFALKDVIALEDEYKDNETGELRPVTRWVLFNDKGESYITSATGINNAMKFLFLTYGTPETWKDPITIKIIQKTLSNNGNLLTFEVV